jgi:hypothetical protein
VKISDNYVPETSSNRLHSKQAWAAYVRRRFEGADLVKSCQRAWKLSNGEAKGVVYGTISQRVVDKILNHKNGGLSVELEVAAIAWGLTALDLVVLWIDQQKGRNENARDEHDAAARRMVALASRLGAPGHGGDPAGDRGNAVDDWEDRRNPARSGFGRR